MRPMARAHPRVRGEHAPPGSAHSVWAGSSPRARGARLPRAQARRVRGLIPACAGSTVTIAHPASATAAHPRVRGEHRAVLPECRGEEGSSPRARGALGGRASRRRAGGLIPACAGSTGRPGIPAPRGRAHPRVRGEHQDRGSASAADVGSSPRARGARQGLFELPHLSGLIPACAGSTPPPRRSSRAIRAHPRVRGEHVEDLAVDQIPAGSSPRARGAQRHRHRERPGVGLIPACAGST